MTDYEDYNNLAFPPQELSEVDILRAENERLKELLKECRSSIEVDLENARMCESYEDTEYFKGLIVKIDEVLR